MEKSLCRQEFVTLHKITTTLRADILDRGGLRPSFFKPVGWASRRRNPTSPASVAPAPPVGLRYTNPTYGLAGHPGQWNGPRPRRSSASATSSYRIS